MCLFYDGNSRRLNQKWFYGEAGNRTCDPWFTRHSTYPLHHGGFFFVAFLGINRFCQAGLRYICWFHDGNTQRLTESGFMEKPGIKPATPGLQGTALTTTPRRLLFCGFPGYKPVQSGLFKICVGFYNRNTQRLTESGFMEKLGIEPAPLVYKA